VDLQLKGSNCVILGGSRGIGRAIGLSLADEGCNVAFCGRNEASLKKTHAEILGKGVRSYASVCDLADNLALNDFLEASRKSLGNIIHNASAMVLGPSSHDWELSIKVDLMAAVCACEKIIPWMVEAGRGNILFVSSTSGLEADPTPNYGYTAAKAGLIAYAKKLGTLLAPQGIRANAIAPGSTLFPGGIWASRRELQPEIYEGVRASIPWGRLGTPEEIASVAVFLVSPRASWITGQTVSVDGGQHRGMR
jgi:3-oxoacyl-[acyl-carrier protein] reductase